MRMLSWWWNDVDKKEVKSRSFSNKLTSRQVTYQELAFENRLLSPRYSSIRVMCIPLRMVSTDTLYPSSTSLRKVPPVICQATADSQKENYTIITISKTYRQSMIKFHAEVLF